MQPTILYDVPIWAIYISAGCLGIVWIFTGLLIIAIEALVLRLLKWGTLRRAIRDAFLMNVASALIGCAVPVILLATDSVPGTLLGLGVAWALSIGIEGGVLTLINSRMMPEKHSAREVWLASLAANTASYMMLAVLILLWSFLET